MDTGQKEILIRVYPCNLWLYLRETCWLCDDRKRWESS